MSAWVTLQDGLVNVPGLFFVEVRVALVVAFVLIAAVADVRSHRIPNLLVAAGIVTGVAWQWVQPALVGGGVVWALEGVAVGIAMLLPLYLLRAMGAGDVKLMGMVGAFLGPGGVFTAALMAIVAGGILALVIAASTGVLGRLFVNLKLMVFGALGWALAGGRAESIAPYRSAGNLPYAVAIALGTVAYLAWQAEGGTLF